MSWNFLFCLLYWFDSATRVQCYFTIPLSFQGGFFQLLMGPSNNASFIFLAWKVEKEKKQWAIILHLCLGIQHTLSMAFLPSFVCNQHVTTAMQPDCGVLDHSFNYSIYPQTSLSISLEIMSLKTAWHNHMC